MPGTEFTSIARELGRTDRPSTESVEEAAWIFARSFAAAIDAPLVAEADRSMPSGLFELRQDPITGWWVATVVDREFHRDRFARAAEPVDDRLFGCANCAAPGEGVRTRSSRTTHSTWSGPRARHANSTGPRDRPGLARPGARDRLMADRRRPARRASAAARGRHRLIEGLVAGAATPSRGARRRQTEYLRSSRTGARRRARGRTTCASTCTTCRRSRTGSARSWAAPRGS